MIRRQQLCRWEDYVGQQWWCGPAVGLTAAEFGRMSKLAAWAVALLPAGGNSDDGSDGGVYEDEEYEVARLLAHRLTSVADEFLVD